MTTPTPPKWTDSEADSLMWFTGCVCTLGGMLSMLANGWVGGVLLAAMCAGRAAWSYLKAFPRQRGGLSR